MSLYTEIVRTGVAFRRPGRILSNAVHAFRSLPTTGKPFLLKMESAAVCNLRCKMCPQNNNFTRPQGVLKFENFKKVFDEVDPPYLNLTWIGEPLINPDLCRMIAYARGRGAVVKMDTNATLLDEKKASELLDAGPNFVSVSLDGITKQSYESIRTGANFEEVIRNLKRFVALRNERRSRTKIHLFFVMQKDNVSELPSFVRFGSDLGADSINGALVLPAGEEKSSEHPEITREGVAALKKELAELKKTLRVPLNIETVDSFLNNYEFDAAKTPCFWPWYQVTITWDGYVVPCCMHYYKEIDFGNAFQEPLMKIWNNEKAQAFREQLVKERVGICHKCGVDETAIFNGMSKLLKIPGLRNLSARKGC